MKLDLEKIQQINLFEKITRASLKDCFVNNEIYFFIVQSGHISKAIGKQGSNVKKLSNIFKKRIKIAEYNSDPIKFLESLIHPLKVRSELKENFIEIEADTKTKALLIGRNRRNLTFYNEILRKYFNLEVKIKNG